VESLEEFEVTRERGYTLYGVGKKYRRRAQRMQPDDRVLVYVSPLRKWTATATITSGSFEDYTLVWKPTRRDGKYPYRIKMAPDIVLDEVDYIDALMLAPGLEYVKHWAPEYWPLAFFDKLHLLPQRDFRMIEREMKRNLTNRRKTETRVGPAAEEPVRTEDPGVASADVQVQPAGAPDQIAAEGS
jgi:hypothetical protein